MIAIHCGEHIEMWLNVIQCGRHTCSMWPPHMLSYCDTKGTDGRLVAGTHLYRNSKVNNRIHRPCREDRTSNVTFKRKQRSYCKFYH